MKLLINTLFIFFVFSFSSIAQIPGNDCASAPTKIISSNSSSVGSFFISYNWDNYTSSDVNNSSPRIEEDVEIQYGGKDFWISFNSVDIQYLSIGSNSDYFNIFPACGGNAIEPTTAGLLTYYELQPNTTYLLQGVLQVSEVSDAYTQQQLNRRAISILYQKSIDNIECDNATNLTLSEGEITVNRQEQIIGFPYYVVQPTSDLFIKSPNLFVFLNDCNEVESFTPIEKTGVYYQLETGQSYLLRIPKSRTGHPQYINVVSAPQNVNCSNRTLINLGELQEVDKDLYPSNVEFNGNSAFYEFVAPPSGAIRTSSIEVEVFEADCSNLIERFINKSNRIYGLTPGQTYYVIVRSNKIDGDFSISEIPSQVPNNTCALASLLTPSPITVQSVNFKYTSRSQKIDLGPPNLIGDVWYELNNSNEKIKIKRIQGTNLEKYVKLFKGDSCTNIQEVSSVKWTNFSVDVTLNTPPLTGGEKYYLALVSRLSTTPLGIGNDVFEFTVEEFSGSGITPNNDDCSNAIPYTSNSTTGEPSLPDINLPFCNPQDHYLGNKWYTFTPTATSSKVTLLGSTTIFSGTCNNLVPVDCSYYREDFPNSEIRKNIVLTPGQEYLFSTPKSTFTMTASTNNDIGCEDAIELPQVVDFSLLPNNDIHAYDIGAPELSCATEADNKLSDIWFRVTTDNIYNTIYLKGYQHFGIYSDDCNNLTEVACGRASSRHPSEILLNPNQTYLLRILGTTVSTFQYKFESTPIENDNCLSAPQITISESPTLIERNTVMTPSVPNFSCASEPINDLWKAFTAPASGTIFIQHDNPNGSPDYFIELYSDCNNPVAGSCLSNDFVIYENLTPSSTYYLRTTSTNDPEDQSYIYSQSIVSNGDCSQALQVNVDDCLVNTEGNSYGNANGVWFKTIIPGSGAFILQSNSDFQATIYANSCTNLELHSEILTQSNTLVEGIPVGEEVFIKIAEDNLFNFCLLNAFSEGSPNTFCDYGIELTNIANSDCNVTNEVEITDHRKNNFRLSWYYFTATTPNMEVKADIIYRDIILPRRMTIYDSCNGERIHSAIASSTASLTNLTIGQDYYLAIETRIFDADIQSACSNSISYEECFEQTKKESRIDFSICIKENPIPAINDLCANAISLTLSGSSCGSSLQDSTHNAYDDYFDCNYGSKEVWYNYAADPDGGKNITVKLENNSVPLQIAVFEESCEGRQIVCAKDSAIIVTKPDTDYYIAVSRSADQENSNYQICIRELVLEESEDNVGVDVENPAVKLQVNGGISIGESNVNLPGAIRFDGIDFQGFTSEGWKSFSQINDLESLDVLKDNLGSHQANQDLNLAGHQINQVGDPESNSDAANKNYVDNAVLGVKSMIADSLNSIVDSSQFDAFRNGELVQVDDPNSGGKEYEIQWEAKGDTIRVDVSELWDLWYNDLDNIVWTEYPVGIETDTPDYPLDVNGIINSQEGYRLEGSSLVKTEISYDENDEDQLNIDVFPLDPNAQVIPQVNFTSGGIKGFSFDILAKRFGIGTDDPNASLHFDKNNSSNYLQIDKNGNTQTVIDNDGYLGIGVANPQEAIDVEGTVQIKKNSSSGNPHINIIEDGADFVRLNMTNSTSKNIVIAALSSTSDENSKINFNIEGPGDVFTIAGNERVGINDNTPDYTLDVEAQAGANPLRVGTSSATDTYLKIVSSGYAGIGGDPSSDLHVHHDNIVTENGLRIENNASSNHWRMFVSSSGDLRLYRDSQNSHIGKFDYTSGAYSTNSDRRLKENISDLHFNWNKFMSLKPSNYSFISDEKRRIQLGLIAQDVEEVYPEIVYKNEETGMYKMDYSGTGVIAIKAVQELKKENEELLQRNQKLEQELENLKIEIVEIKKMIRDLKK